MPASKDIEDTLYWSGLELPISIIDPPEEPASFEQVNLPEVEFQMSLEEEVEQSESGRPVPKKAEMLELPDTSKAVSGVESPIPR